MSIFGEKSTVSNKLQSIRKSAKMTQEDLGSRVNVTRQTIISIEKGKYTPSLPLAFAIAKEFNTSIEGIFTYEEK